MEETDKEKLQRLLQAQRKRVEDATKLYDSLVERGFVQRPGYRLARPGHRIKPKPPSTGS